MNTKLISMLAIILVIGLAALNQQNQTPNIVKIETPPTLPTKNYATFPLVDFITPEGHSFKINQLKEQTILVHFWAAWCAPCQAELTDLIKYVVKSNGKIGLISVSLDPHYTDSQKILDTIKGTHMPHLYWAWDQDKTLSLHSFNTVQVPETIIVKDGMMTDKIIGAGPWAEVLTSQ